MKIERVEIPKRFKASLLRRFTPTDADIAAGKIEKRCPLCVKFGPIKSLDGCLPECPFKKIYIPVTSLAPCLPWLSGMKGKWMEGRVFLLWDEYVNIDHKKSDPWNPETKAFGLWSKKVKSEFAAFRNRALKHIKWV
jgi:hypothetical protein